VKKCPYCQNTINLCDGNHIYRCGNKNGLYDKKQIKYEFISFNFPKISNSDILKKEYEVDLKSLPMLKKEYGIDFKSVIFLLDYFSIKKRSISESSIKISRNKFVKTMMDRYNTDNPSRVDEFKKKREQTCIDRFGVDNIRKIRNFLKIVEKTVKEKYGITYSELKSQIGKKVWEKLTDEERNIWLDKSIRSDKCFNNNKNKGYHSSKLETSVQEILNKMGVTYTTQFCLKINKMRRFYDFLLVDIKLIIEVNGDYWHANPKLYERTDILNYKFGIKTAEDIWNKDKIKKDLAEKKGYHLMYIWESEIHENEYNLEDFVITKIKNNFL